MRQTTEGLTVFSPPILQIEGLTPEEDYEVSAYNSSQETVVWLPELLLQQTALPAHTSSV